MTHQPDDDGDQQDRDHDEGQELAEREFAGRKTAAGLDSSLGVGHIWTNERCPAYRTFASADCICQRDPGILVAERHGRPVTYRPPLQIDDPIELLSRHVMDWGGCDDREHCDCSDAQSWRWLRERGTDV